MATVAVAYLLAYVFMYDKSYYHIDTVREPMIRFLFFESMLLGAFFRVNDGKLRNRKRLALHVSACVILFLLYFASKLAFSRVAGISSLQIVNQLLIFALLVKIMNVFSALDSRLVMLPEAVKKIIGFVASITLEIYVVQYAIIDKLRNVAPFPLNWIILTASIIGTAFILHWVCQHFLEYGNRVVAAIRRG